MKVAMLGWEYPPFKVGGLGTHCYGLTHGLAEKNVHIDFYMPKLRQKVKSDNKNIKIIEVGEPGDAIFPYDRPDDKALGGKFFDLVYRYNNLLAARVKGNYDVVHVHDWLTMKAGVQIKEKLHIPLVLTVHSTEYDRAGMLYPNQWFIDLEREGMQKADRIIAVSNYTKKIVVEKYGIPAEKITVIHNAVYPTEEEGEKKPLVLFLGRLTIQKGPEFFLKAAKKVLEYEDAKFVIAGVGDMMPKLINQAVDMGISNKVVFTGKLSDEEVQHIYKISSIYVMPSVSEPFGITALEAISAGTPTIVSRSAGVSEVLKNCFKVDFWDTDEMANKIIALLRYDSLHSTMRQSSKREVQLFTWDRVADQTLRVYRGLA